MKKVRTGMTDSIWGIHALSRGLLRFPKICGWWEREKKNNIIEFKASLLVQTSFLLFESQITVCSAPVKHFDYWNCVIITHVG